MRGHGKKIINDVEHVQSFVVCEFLDRPSLLHVHLSKNFSVSSNSTIFFERLVFPF